MGRVWSAGLIAGIAGAVGLLLVGPALAHESPTTAVAPTSAAAGVVPAQGAPMSSGGTVSAGAAEGSKSGASQWRYVLVVLAATAVGTLALRLGLHVFKPNFAPRLPETVAAAALVFTGIAHGVVVPEHWAEGWHLGAFFVASALLLSAQGIAVWIKPTVIAYWSVVASSAVMIALYFLAREVSLPLVNHTDPYLLEELPVKLSEVLAAALAVAALARAEMVRGRHPALVSARRG